MEDIFIQRNMKKIISWDTIIYLLIACTVFLGFNIKQREVWAKDLLSPMGEGVYVAKEEERPLEVTTEGQEENLSPIEKEIKEVFGEYTPKAFLLLKGNDVCGGENRGLNPLAVNVNKDGSKDFSIFQINDKYHPVYKLNLNTDWKANIKYAWRMFERDGYTFSKRWVAGRCLKLEGLDI